MAANGSQLEYNIRSVGMSTIVLGGFYAFMAVFTILIWIGSVVAENTLTVVSSILSSGLLALFWILMGVSVRRHSGNPKKALKLIMIVMYVAVVLLALGVLQTISYGASSGVIISAVFASYMIWSYIDIKDRIAGKKR